MRHQTRKWFYLPELPKPGQTSWLPKALSHRLGQVLRSKVGQQLVLFDGNGQIAHATLTQMERSAAEVHIEHSEQQQPTQCQISVALPICSRNTMAQLYDQATQLGCQHFYPTLYEWSKSTGQHKRLDNKLLARWHTIVVHAAEQSEQSWLPTLHPPQTLPEVLAQTDTAHLIELGFKPGLNVSDLQQLKNSSMLLCLGPEGGMTAAESKLLAQHQAQQLYLNANVLTVETALVCALGLLNFPQH